MVRTQHTPDPSSTVGAVFVLYYCSDDCVEQAYEAQDVHWSDPYVPVDCDYCGSPIH